MIELPDDLGPKMRALRTDQQRRFAYAMASGGYDTPTDAAREAGYSDAGDAAKVRACGLMQNTAVLDAIEEASLLVLRGLGPLAIKAAKAILENPNHRAHARIIETVLDRAGFAAKTEHTVKVEHTVDTTELEALALRLAHESGIPVERLIGVNGIGVKVIEHQPEELNHVSRETPDSNELVFSS